MASKHICRHISPRGPPRTSAYSSPVTTTSAIGNSGEITSPDQAKELIALSCAGKLYELEKWIAEGKSLDISSSLKRGRHTTLLQIAVKTGFHSLVELIAKNENSQSSKNAALADAASARRLDLVEVLLEHGANIKSVSLVDVLLTWEPKIIRFFLDHGADVLEGRPFAVAFGERIRTALRPFLDYKQTHPELAAQLQEQLDCALRYFCSKGDLKWVSLLMWAGGDPRSRGPCLNEEYTDDPECYTSDLDEACRSENPDVLKRLKPDPTRDDFSELLRHAASWPRKEVLEFLLEIGANPNDKPNGGSSALDSALRDLSFAGWEPYGSNRLKPKYKVSRSPDCVRQLLARGAIWNPSENHDLNSLRRSLLECEPDVTIELLRLFREHSACPAERVRKLLGTPKMKEHLKPEANSLLRLGIHLDAAQNLKGRRPTSIRGRVVDHRDRR